MKNMGAMKLKERDLKKIFQKSKNVSNNFRDIESMLLQFPQSILILRFAAREGRKKFGKRCKISYSEMTLIEKGNEKLGTKRVRRIVEHTKNLHPDFSWNSIKKVYMQFLDYSKNGAKQILLENKFIRPQDLIPLEQKRNNLVKILKLRNMDKNEKNIFRILNSNMIPFERQVPIENSLQSPKMIVVDFAIPSSVKPRVVIEVTSSKIKFRKGGGDQLTTSGFRKIILGYRLKRFIPQAKLILFSSGETDEHSKGLLLEGFDFVINSNKLSDLPFMIRGILNANQN